MKRFLAFLLACATVAEADIVVLKSGSKMEGTARVEKERVVLLLKAGETQFTLDKIERIEWSEGSKEPARLRAELAAMKSPALERARWAVRFGLADEAKKEWEAVLVAEPENAEALKALSRKKPAKPAVKEPPPAKAAPAIVSGPEPWPDFANGLTLRTEHFTIRGDLSRERFLEIAPVAERMNAFHCVHFGASIGKDWKITLFQKKADFIAYSKKIGSTQYGGGGYCENQLKEFVGHGEAGHSLETLVKHELGHAYYYCPGPFWLREGAAVLVEGLEWESNGTPVIRLNGPRLREIRGYWKEGKHTGLRCCTLKPVFPLAYAHHWSFHYYVWVRKGPEFYRKMLKDLQSTKEKDDLTERVVTMLGAGSLEDLEKDWKSFIEGLK